MNKLALAILFSFLPVPMRAASYFLAPAVGGGNDSNNGLTSSTPWLTPKHAVNCGDVIVAAASTAYSAFNFGTGEWGTVNCPAGNNVAWVKCVTFDACLIKTNTVNGGMYVYQSYWGVQGFEVQAVAGGGGQYAFCFAAAPPFASPVEVHHIIFANDIANGCMGSGFATNNTGGSTTASADYIAVIGSIAYNAAQGNGECFSGISIYQPIASDSLSGTHIYIAGNFSWDNVVPDPCGGFHPPYDGEGITLDTLDGSQSRLPHPYAQQIVVDNNLIFLNGSSGFSVEGGGNTAAPVYFRHNTLYGNSKDTNQSNASCGEILIGTYPNMVVSSTANYNLAETSQATGGSCGAGNPRYALSFYNGGATNSMYSNFAYTPTGYNTQVVSNTGFSFGPNNVFGTNPNLQNTVDPGPPNCGGALSVTNCMATVIANFTPQMPLAVPYGYQKPNTTQTYDPLFPQWLCNVNLPAGLVTMGCIPLASLPAGVTITRVSIQ